MGTLIFLTRAELKVIAEVVCDPHSVEFIKALEENTEFEAIPLTSLTSEGFKEYMREDIPFVIETIHDSILKTYSRAFGKIKSMTHTIQERLVCYVRLKLCYHFTPCISRN